MTTIDSIDDLVRRIPDGARIALPAEYSYVPMDIVRALIRRQIRNMDIVCVPIGGLAVDMLIGAGCVRSIEAAAVSLGENGLAPRFTDAVENRRIVMTDSTCPAIHTALQASEKGVPFMPLSGLIGSDILRHRNDWKVIDDPLQNGNGPIVLIPAIQPDIALIHSPVGDRAGNVWIGKRRELMTLAHAARETVVTVERITDDDLLASDESAAGVLPNLYISAVACAPRGAMPLALAGCYRRDDQAISEYARAARSQQGYDRYLAEQGLQPVSDAAE